MYLKCVQGSAWNKPSTFQVKLRVKLLECLIFIMNLLRNQQHYSVVYLGPIKHYVFVKIAIM